MEKHNIAGNWPGKQFLAPLAGKARREELASDGYRNPAWGAMVAPQAFFVSLRQIGPALATPQRRFSHGSYGFCSF